MKRAEIALAILLEVITVDYDRWRCLAFPAVLFLRFVVGVGIPGNEDQAFAIRRPVEFRNATLHIRQFLGFSTGAIEEPHLGTLLLLGFITARCQECEVFVVGTPARRTFAAVGGGGQADLLGSIPADHPDIRVALVFLGV